VVGPSPPLARILELAQSFFGPDSGGFGIVVEADAGLPVEDELRAAGWKVFEDEPALVLSAIPAAPPLPHGLQVRPVRDADSRRGLGTALTWAALREGAQRGCTCATLAALGASFDLYRKMGFIHVCNHRAYGAP